MHCTHTHKHTQREIEGKRGRVQGTEYRNDSGRLVHEIVAASVLNVTASRRLVNIGWSAENQLDMCVCVCVGQGIQTGYASMHRAKLRQPKNLFTFPTLFSGTAQRSHSSFYCLSILQFIISRSLDSFFYLSPLSFLCSKNRLAQDAPDIVLKLQTNHHFRFQQICHTMRVDKVPQKKEKRVPK